MEIIASIIVGGLSGWLAKMFMKSNTGMIVNILLGIIGSALASFILNWLGINFYGWIGYLIAGFVGACCLIAIGRLIKR